MRTTTTQNTGSQVAPTTGSAWYAQAEALARWVMARMVNRNDRCGGSYVDGQDRKVKRTTRPSKGPQSGYVSHRLLVAHFRATKTEDVIGLHALGPDSHGRWLGIDIDAHEGEAVDPEANLRFALDLYALLAGFGFRVLLYESNGSGGYHLLVLFTNPVPGEILFRFGHWLVRDQPHHEVFPKQPKLDEKTQFGNWLRVIGRHHKREFWPRVWDGSTWLEGSAAVDHLLTLGGDSAAQIPEAALEYEPDPQPQPRAEAPKQRSGTPGVSIFEQFNRAQTAEDMAKLLERAEWETVKKGNDVWTFKRKGSANDQNGNLKLINGVWVFYAFSHKTKISAGQGLNPAQLRAEVEFGGHDTRHMNALALRLEQEGFVGLPPVARTQASANRTTSAPVGVNGHQPQNGTHPNPAEVVAKLDPTVPSAVDPLPGPEDDKPPVDLSDVGNGYAFRVDHLSVVRFVDVWDSWLIWDSCRWEHDRSRHAEALGKQTVGRLFREAAEDVKRLGPSTGDRTEQEKAASRAAEMRLAHAKKSHQAKAIRDMLAMARSELGIRQIPEVFDTDPWALNTLSGTVDLRTGNIHPHRREDYLTKLCPTQYAPEATCPAWEQFLDLVFGNDADLIGFVRRLFGYCLTGDTREHLLAVFVGNGSNGKSTLLEVLMDVFGPDYAMKAPPGLLMARDHEAHPTERAGLHGKRLVCAVETEDGRRLAETLVKELTGGDKISARKMRQDFFEFAPTHKLILCTNHKPQVRGSDNGIWRRLRLVPFNVQFWNPDVASLPGEIRPDHLRADKGMKDRLLAEREGILAWAVRGCLEWQANGLGNSEKVSEATATYQAEENVIGRFIVDRCEVHASYRVKASDLYATFRTWCQYTGVEPLPAQRSFGLMMSQAGYGRSANGSWYIGLSLAGSDVPE